MLPYLHVPFVDQLGMSERLHGARRSALQWGFVHQLQKLLLNRSQESLDKIVQKYRNALERLMQLAAPQCIADHLAAHTLRDHLGVGDLEPNARTDHDATDRSAENDPVACLLAVTLHCIGHTIAERAFAVGEKWGDEPGAMGDGDAEAEDSAGLEAPESLSADDINNLLGVAPEKLAAIDVTRALLRVRLGSALRYMTQDAHRQKSEVDAVNGEQPAPLGLLQQDFELFAEGLLEALPAALGNQSITWKKLHFGGKTHALLVLDEELHDQLLAWLQGTPLTLTLQPLINAPQYSRHDDAGTDLADQARNVPLLGYRRVNRPLTEFFNRLESRDFRDFVQGVNAQQRVAWRVNRRLLTVAQALCDLGPHQATESQPPGLTGDQLADCREWVAEHLFSPTSSGRRHKILPGQFLLNPLVVSVFEDAFDGDEHRSFYLPWKADYRGRIYAETPWFTPQGGDLQRAMLEFAEGDVLSDAGLRALRRHGGNLVDKKALLADLGSVASSVPTLFEREQWVTTHHEQILASASDPLGNPFWREHSSKPWQFLAFCFAYVDATQGHRCHLPVQIDGTCNGLQHIAALTGNSKLAKEVNVFANTDANGEVEPADIYTRIAELACARLRAGHGMDPELARARTMDALLASQPQAFFLPPAGMVLPKKKRNAANNEAVLAPCREICVKTDGIDASDLAEWVLERLCNARTMLRKQGQKQIAAEDLASAVVDICKEAVDRPVDALVGSDLLMAMLGTTKERRFEACLSRAVTKTIVMTIPYGAGERGQREEVAKTLENCDLSLGEDEIKRLHDRFESQSSGDHAVRTKFDANREARWLLALVIVRCVREVIDQNFPAIPAFAGTLYGIAASTRGLPLMWWSPIGLPVLQDGFRIDERSTLSAQISPQSRINISFVRLCDDVDPDSQRTKLLPNLIHSLDATHLILTLCALDHAKVNRFGSIHDCLLIHPNDADLAGRIVREQFARMYHHEKGRVPRIFLAWLDWMALLHQVAAFPLRTQLQTALATIRNPDRGIPGMTMLLIEQVREANLGKLEAFLQRAHDGVMTPQDETWLDWLIFLLQHANPPMDVESWPQLETASDSDFRMDLVNNSPYFFS